MSDHIFNTAYRHGRHNYRKIKPVSKKYKEGLHEWLKDKRNSHPHWRDEDHEGI